jgi:adenine deaminase
VVTADMGVQAELPLTVAGLLPVEPYEEGVRETEACVAALRELDCTFPSPFQMMAGLGP